MFTMRTIQRLLLAAVMLLVAAPSFAQMVSNNNEDGVNKAQWKISGDRRIF